MTTLVIAQPQQIINIKKENEQNINTTIKKESFVGKWFFSLKAICIFTISFSVFGLLFSVLDQYDDIKLDPKLGKKVGTKIKDGTSLQSLEGNTAFLFALPILLPLFILVFLKAESFAEERSNEGRNRAGEMKKVINGKEVTRMVFSNWPWALGVTLATWICFITSFIVFFFYGIPRCKKENQNLNEGLVFSISKSACFLAFRLGIMQFILGLIIVMGSLSLWYLFYSAMPMSKRKKTNNYMDKKMKTSKKPRGITAGNKKQVSLSKTTESLPLPLTNKNQLKKSVKRTVNQSHKQATTAMQGAALREVAKAAQAKQQRQYQAATTLQGAVRQRQAREVAKAAQAKQQQQDQAATALQGAVRQRKAMKVAKAAQAQQQHLHTQKSPKTTTDLRKKKTPWR